MNYRDWVISVASAPASATPYLPIQSQSPSPSLLRDGLPVCGVSGCGLQPRNGEQTLGIDPGLRNGKAAARGQGRIEIYFRSQSPQTVTVSGRRFAFAAGERVHTEYSYKYDDDGIAALAASGGFAIAKTWIDPERLFAVAWLQAAA